MNELEQIITIHEKLIYKIAKSFHNIPITDLFQAGIIGLIKAYNKYDKNSETKFSTYAYNYIFGEMYELANNSRAIKLNKDILKLYKKIEQTKNILSQRLGYEPSITEIAIYLQIDENQIRDIYNATSSIMSLDNDEEKNIYEVIGNNDKNQDNIIDLKESINTLSEEEQKIIKLRYFKDYTQQETAIILGLSQVKVSRYEKKSLTKMYNYLAS